jgi:hypothetical protein
VFFSLIKTVEGQDVEVMRYPLWPGDQLSLLPSEFLHLLKETHNLAPGQEEDDEDEVVKDNGPRRMVGEMLHSREIGQMRYPIYVGHKSSVAVKVRVGQNGEMTFR